MAANENKIRILIEAEVKKALDEIKKIEKSSRKTSSTLGGMKKAFVAIGGVFAAGKIVSGIKSIVKSAADFEKLQVSFTTFLGSAEKANRVLGQLEKFSIVTPFTIDQVNEAGKSLLAFGIAAEDLQPSLKSIGDIAAGTGKDFNELAVIYGKARVQGTLFAEDINQLTEAGVPVIDEFARLMGVSTGEVKKLGSEGKITFDLLEQAFQDMTTDGGQFFNLMEKQSKTVAGRISTLEGNFQLLQRRLGQEMMPVVEAAIEGLERLMDNDDAMESLADGARLLASAFSLVLSSVLSLTEGTKHFVTDMTDGLKSTARAIKDFFKGNFKSASDSVADFENRQEKRTEAHIEKQKKIWEDFAKVQRKIWKKNTDVAKEQAEATSDAEVEETELKNEALLEQDSLHKEELLINHMRWLQEKDRASEEFAKKEVGRQISAMGSILSFTQQTMNTIMGIMDKKTEGVLTNIENERRALEQQLEQGIINEEEFAAKKEELDKKERKAKNEAARKQKKNAVIQAVMAANLASINAFASGAQINVFLGIAMAAVALAAGLANAAAIQSQPVPQYATGTDFAPGGTALVGEMGPELVNLPRGSQVVPNDITRELLSNGNGFAGTTNSENSINISNISLPGVKNARNFVDELNELSDNLGTRLFSR